MAKDITAILTAYRRPNSIKPLVEAIRGQRVSAAAIWAWANDPNEKMKAVLAEAKLDRVVTSSENARFHGRFALALLARTEFVANFDGRLRHLYKTLTASTQQRNRRTQPSNS